MASIDRENPEFLAEIQRREREEEAARMAYKFRAPTAGAQFDDLDASNAQLAADTDATSRPTYLDAQVRYAKAAAPVYRPRRAYQQHHTPAPTFDAVAASTFVPNHLDVLGWVDGNHERDDFARDLLAYFKRKGFLTPGQVAAVRKQLADKAKHAAVVAAVTEPLRPYEEQFKGGYNAAGEAATNGLDLRGVPSGMYAVPGGDTRLKVRIDNVQEGKWAGWVFVKDGAEYGHGKRYGAQRPGQRYRGEIVAELTAIAANPEAACAAYGQLVGRCGICGRKLEDENSVARGIGPICAAKQGW